MSESASEASAERAAVRVGLYSLGLNLLLVGLKAGLAWASGSLAVAADAVHSLVDVVGSLVVLIGVVIARRRSGAFPYGLYKVENVASVVVAFLIFLAGYEIAREAILGQARLLANVPIVLLGMGVAVLAPYLFSRYEGRLAVETGSPSLRADSRHFATDVLSSAVVFVAVLGDLLGLPLDRVGAGVVVIFILWSGWELLVDGMRVLLDASLSHETLEQVREVVASDPLVAEIRRLVGRNSGRYRFIEMELVLRTHDLERAHRVSERLERAIRERVARVDRVMIHYEPLHKDTWRWAIPLDESEGRVSDHFGEAPHFALVDVRTATHELSGWEVLDNPYRMVEKQKGIRVAEFLVAQGVDGVVVMEPLEGKGPAYVLGDAGVEVVRTETQSLSDLLPELARR